MVCITTMTGTEALVIVAALLISAGGVALNLWLMTRYLNRRYPRPTAPTPAPQSVHRLAMERGTSPDSPWAATCACREWGGVYVRYRDAEDAYAVHVK